MRVAVLSGKGGAGKTLVAVNLAAAAKAATYIDCDVEEPNGRLFLKPQNVEALPVSTLLPAFDAEKCSGCRACVDFCRFNALAYLRNKPMVFPEVCHACGGCSLVCPENAISEVQQPVGQVEIGWRDDLRIVTGILDLGQASGVPVIHAALEAGADEERMTVIDCPPGSACSVMESVGQADLCLLVAEPTAFGFHNFQMVYQLTRVMEKPCAVVINKQDAPYEPLEAFCREQKLPVLLRLPFREATARLCADGRLLRDEDPEAAADFDRLLREIGGMAG